MNSRILIRFSPWIAATIIVVVIYALLDFRMQEELEKAKLKLRQNYVEGLMMDIGRLELMHYKFKDVLFFQTLKPFLENKYDIPDSEPIVIVKGTVVAGIDFDRITPADLEFENDSNLVLVIPKPSQFDYTLDDEIQIITNYKIDKEDISSAINQMVASGKGDLIKPLDLDIREEHFMKILQPVLANMTKEKITIKFIDPMTDSLKTE